MSKQTITKFKETEIGLIPEGWRSLELKDVCTLQRGFDLPKNERDIGLYPLVAANGISENISEYKVIGPGVTTGRSGTLGKSFYIKENFWPLNTSLWVKNFKNNDPYWIYLLISSLNLQDFNAGSGVPTLNRNHLDQVKINLPPIVEQHQIAEVLSSLDDKIELNRKINTNLEKLASALFKKWFVDIGDKLPEGWRMGKVSDLVKVESGFPFNSSMFDESGDYKLVTIKNVQDGQFVSECTDSLSIMPEKIPDHCKLKTGDILLSLTGNVGRICIVTGENYLLNQRVAVLVPINERDRAYTYLLFRQKDFQNTLMGISRGTAQQNLSPIETKSLELIIPSDEALKHFSSITNPIFEALVDNFNQIKNLSILRDSLLPRLMSGKIRTKNHG